MSLYIGHTNDNWHTKNFRHQNLLANYIAMISDENVKIWYYPLSDKFDHMFWAWPTSRTLLSRLDIAKIHHHFHHGTSEKLYELLKRARPNKENEKVFKSLQNSAENAKYANSLCLIHSDSESVCHQMSLNWTKSSQWTWYALISIRYYI